VVVTAEQERYAADAAVLARIGRALFSQPTGLEVRLPQELADLALAAWARDEDDGPLGEESREQSIVRHRAGTLALIGLCIEHSAGGAVDGDNVLVDLDAWHIGSALEAADDAGLLADVFPGSFQRATAPISAKKPIHLYAVIRIDFEVPRAEGEAAQAATSGPFYFDVTVKEVLPTADQAVNEVRRLNDLNQDKRCVYIWQVTRYYPDGRKGSLSRS
jgi:hypothetical protein